MSFYSHDDNCERLYYEELNDAVYEYLRDTSPARWERTVTFYRYDRVTITDDYKTGLVEAHAAQVLEELDEEYGDPDCVREDTTEVVRAAARVFIDTVLSTYKVWLHEIARKVDVNILDWVESHGYDEYPQYKVESVEQALTRLRIEAQNNPE